MTAQPYTPTLEQLAIIDHDGDAFIRACPGAGKTCTMVERARRTLATGRHRRGVAFLSFTNAAVDELEARLRSFGVLPYPLFPTFVGTFDRFLWQFLLAPFGVDGCDQIPRLVPDKGQWEVKPPYDNAQALTLDCFDRETGAINTEKAAEVGFRPRSGPRAWETTARKILARARVEGKLDFEDVRQCVRERLQHPNFATRVGAALAGRFQEIVVDEAQDCNPADLQVVGWLRSAGIPLKVICDPDQAIYAFRGGVTNHLQQFAETFETADQLPMSGNFRSSPAICAAISKLRPPTERRSADVPLGHYKDEATPVYLLAYGGQSVPRAIGAKFQELAAGLGIAPADAPVLASTWASAGNAVGRPAPERGNEKSLLLAEAAMNFHFSFEAGSCREALARLHRIVLLVRGYITHVGAYSNYVAGSELENGRWRPEVITIGQALRFEAGESANQWLERARELLSRDLVGHSTINQRLRSNEKLAGILVLLCHK